MALLAYNNRRLAVTADAMDVVKIQGASREGA